MMEEGRGRKEPSDRRNPVANSNLSAGRSWKWGGTGQGKPVTGWCKKLLVSPSMGGKHRQAMEAGRRGAFKVDDHSAPRKYVGGGEQVKREREAESTGARWGVDKRYVRREWEMKIQNTVGTGETVWI